MNSNLDWIKDIVKENGWEYEKISCPLFENGECTSYNNRPNCCRSYPQKDSYCSSKKCAIYNAWLDWKTESNNVSCFSCSTVCCEWILVPKHVQFTKDEILKWLDISCEDCRELF